MATGFRIGLALLSCLIMSDVIGRTLLPPATDEAKTIVIPFHLNKDGMPLIDGAIDGTRGVFLFDTGNATRFLLNRHYVSLGQGTQVSRGTFASGQILSVERHEGEHKADVAGLLGVSAHSGSRQAPEAVMSIDARQQEQGIDPHLLGWIGWGFFKDYVMTIDPVAMTIRLDPPGTTPKAEAKMRQSTVVISFTPSSPVVPFFIDIGGYLVPAVVDTAGRDELALSVATWAKLTSSGALRFGPGTRCVNIKRASFGGVMMPLTDLERVERAEERLTLGVDFIRRFTSRWEPASGTVTLSVNGVRAGPRKRTCA